MKIGQFIKIELSITAKVILILLVGVVLTSSFWVLKNMYDAKAESERAAREKQILSVFAESMPSAKVTQYWTPEEMRVAIWQDGEVTGISIYIDGVWIKLGTQQANK